MNKTTRAALISVLALGSVALVGCGSKDPDPPKVEMATPANTFGKSPSHVSGAGGAPVQGAAQGAGAQ